MNSLSIMKKSKYNILLSVAAFAALLTVQCAPRYEARSIAPDPAKMADFNKGLKDYYKDYFPIGVAVSMAALHVPDSALIVREFNSVTPENDMKMGPIQIQW